MDAERRAEIGRFFAKAREQANALGDVLTDLSWAVDGFYRAEQYVGRMAESDVNSVMYWLDEAEKEIERWEADHGRADS